MSIAVIGTEYLAPANQQEDMDVRFIRGRIVTASARRDAGVHGGYRGVYRVRNLLLRSVLEETACDGVFATPGGARDAALDAGIATARKLA